MRFQMTDDSDLTWMRVSTGAKSNVEIVHNALSMYRYLVRQILAGDKIFIGKTHETAAEIKIKQLEAVL